MSTKLHRADGSRSRSPSNQIGVEWSPGNQQWCIVGGGLPQNCCWSAHDSLNEAMREAEVLAEEMSLEIVS